MTLDDIRSAMSRYEVVLEPDQDTPEWWAGAPSVLRAEDGTFYLAARMREGRSPRGKRGYEIRILRSPDGKRFETVNRIRREEAGVPGFERPALVEIRASAGGRPPGRYDSGGCPSCTVTRTRGRASSISGRDHAPQSE